MLYSVWEHLKQIRRKLFECEELANSVFRREIVCPPVHAADSTSPTPEAAMDELQTNLAPDLDPKAPFSMGRFISTQNPFYLISALLVLWGIWLSILPTLEIEHVVVLWGITVGYIILVSISTVAVIRWAHDWSDARTLLLIIPLFCALLSMLFDELLLHRSVEAAGMLGLGFIFSVICFECVVSQTGIKLMPAVRWIYHLMMATLFITPVLLQIVLKVWNSSEFTVTLLSLFPIVVSLEFLLLAFAMPALYRHRQSNGTPYPFPWFPLSLFAVLFVVCMFRLYLLALAFAPGWNYVVVQANNFIPFVFVAGLILVEIDRQKQSSPARLCSFICGIGALIMSFVLTPQLTQPEVVGPTREMTSWLAAGFYIWLAHRHIPFASWGVALATVSLSWISDADGMIVPWYVATMLGAGYLVWQGWRSESGSLMGAASVLMGLVIAYFLPETEFIWHPYVVANMSCLCLLSLHALTRSNWMQEWRDLALIGLIGPYAFSLQEHCIPEYMDYWKEWLTYTVVLSTGLLAYGRVFRSRLASILAAYVIGVNVVFSAVPFFNWLRTTFLGRGLIPLLIGMASLGLGLVITFVKSARRKQANTSDQ